MKKSLVLIDFQKEFITSSRPYYIEFIAESLRNARRCLKFTRIQGWNIIHVVHNQPGAIFNENNEFSQVIDGFEPKDTEKVFVKSKFSCFSSAEFSKELDFFKDHEIYVMGYMSTLCCKCTILDGHCLGLNMHFIQDASSTRNGTKFSGDSHHKHAVDLIKCFAEIHSTSEITKDLD